MNILLLPNDLCLYIASFLEHQDKIMFGSCCLSFSVDVLQHFEFIQEKDLKHNFIHRYIRDENFRAKVAQYILFPEHQLHINVGESVTLILYPFPRSLHVHFEVFREHQTQMEKIQKLHIRLDPFAKWSNLILEQDYGIKHLTLSMVRNFLKPFPVVLPPSLESLKLMGKFSSFPITLPEHLREVYLDNVDCVDNVRMFVNIPKITFWHCKNIVDITPLQNTRDITIDHCFRIVDYRNALTYSRRIKIVHPNEEAIIDINCFKAVQNLQLYNTPNLSFNTLPITLKRLMVGSLYPLSITNFRSLQELNIEYYSKFTPNVKPFGCIPVLRLRLKNLFSLDGLGYDVNPLNKSLKNKVVTLQDMQLITDFTPLNGVPKVSIINCKCFNDLGQLSKVKDLSLMSVKVYENPKPLHAIVPIMSERITLEGKISNNLLFCCPNVKDLDLRHVSGDGERSLDALPTLKNLERLVIPSRWSDRVWDMLNKDFIEFPHISDDLTFIYLRDNE